MIVEPYTASVFHRWRPIANTDLGPMNLLSSMIENGETREPGLIPDLHRPDEIYILSDFGGEHEESVYEAASFLVLDVSSLHEWDRLWRPYRRRHLSDGRRMAFKKLNDKMRQAALPAFLRAAGRLNGLLFTVLFEKKIDSMFQRDEDRPPEFRQWKSRPMEKLMRSLHIASFLLAGLSRPHQDIYWFTDEDEVAPNVPRLYDICEMFQRISSHYIPHPMRNFRFGTAALDDGTRRLEDLLALPDLAAGSLSELLSAHRRSAAPSLSEIIQQPPEDTSYKTKLLLSWLSDQADRLRNLAVAAEFEEESQKPAWKRIRLWGSNEAFL